MSEFLDQEHEYKKNRAVLNELEKEFERDLRTLEMELSIATATIQRSTFFTGIVVAISALTASSIANSGNAEFAVLAMFPFIAAVVVGLVSCSFTPDAPAFTGRRDNAGTLGDAEHDIQKRLDQCYEYRMATLKTRLRANYWFGWARWLFFAGALFLVFHIIRNYVIAALQP